MPSGRTRLRSGRLRIVWALALGSAVAFCLSAAVQARGDDATEARRHAQRASNLAASGKCRQAVAEFDKALAILRDPALLFNRAECHRKLGDKDAALEDYRQFLSDMPKAPNRAEVERRITELSAKEREIAPVPVVVAAPVVPPGPPPARAAAETAIAPRDVAAPPPPAVPAAPVEPTPNPALTLTPPADMAPAASEGGITTRPWFWITVAAVAVAAGVGTFVLLSRDSTSVPSSPLGNYKF